MASWQIVNHEYFPNWKSYRIQIRFTESLSEDPLKCIKEIMHRCKLMYLPWKNAIYSFKLSDNTHRDFFRTRDKHGKPLWLSFLNLSTQLDDAFMIRVSEILNSIESFDVGKHTNMVVMFYEPPDDFECDIEYDP